MTNDVIVRGNLDEQTIQLLQQGANSLYAEGDWISLTKGTDQIDAGVLEIATSVINLIAAGLTIYALAGQFFASLKRAPSFEEVRERVASAAAELGIVEAEVVEVANFKMVSDRQRDVPCVLTIRDSRSGRFYDASYYGKDKVEVVEVKNAS